MNRLRFLRSLSRCALSGRGWGAVLFLSGLLAMPGCLLLSWSSWLPGEAANNSDASRTGSVLGKIPTSPTAVTLEIIFVERPVNDPLLGSRLWDEVDQIGSLAPEDRSELEKIGIRVGRVGANPPQALQTLLGVGADFADLDDKRLVGRRVVLPSGAETEINVGLLKPQAAVEMPSETGPILRTFDSVRGVFRMKATRLQDGWARLEFLPEVHHGRMVTRHVAVPGVPGGYQLKTTQEIERLYRQKFSFDLNLGEMVLITSEKNVCDSLGKNFFHSPEFTGPPGEAGDDSEPDPTPMGIQRLLIVRLTDLKTAKSLYPE